jgi:hypothetical protein
LVRGDSLEGAILTTVAYLDTFAFAPRAKEIHRFLVGHRATRMEVESALSLSPKLVGFLGRSGDLWFLSGKEHLALRRPRFSRHAAALWPKARRIARLIEKTGLASSGLVTGSLAADNADEHADIDFLLTYRSERTWTSFASIRLLKKVPLLGLSELCPNYALSEDSLEVQPQNLFTAWEISKAVPMFGLDVYRRFVFANRWVKRWLPNALPLLDAPEPAATDGPRRRDPLLLRAMTGSSAFRWLERIEKDRKFAFDHRSVGVDMYARNEEGSMDRHSPTRSSYALSELFYRMTMLGLEAHPLYEELRASREVLAGEMRRWGREPIGRSADQQQPSPA